MLEWASRNIKFPPLKFQFVILENCKVSILVQPFQELIEVLTYIVNLLNKSFNQLLRLLQSTMIGCEFDASKKVTEYRISMLILDSDWKMLAHLSTTFRYVASDHVTFFFDFLIVFHFHFFIGISPILTLEKNTFFFWSKFRDFD